MLLFPNPTRPASRGGQDAKVWALVKRSATSGQLTTFHQALT